MSSKISSHEEFESCYLRHKYLKRIVVRPTKEEMAPFLPLTVKVAKDTFFFNQNAFIWAGFGVDDVVSISHTYLYVYLGLFSYDKMPQEKKDKFIKHFNSLHGKDPDETEIFQKNRANLTLFLRQRMEDLIRICNQKTRNINGVVSQRYQYFFGPTAPPKDTELLLKDNLSAGMKRLSHSQFRMIRKRAKAKNEGRFWFDGNYYVSVKNSHKFLKEQDLYNSNADPRLGAHNNEPEETLIKMEEQKLWDDRYQEFYLSTPELKKTVIEFFVENNKKNDSLKEEVALAKKILRELNESQTI